MTNLSNSANYEKLAKEFRDIPIDRTLRTINTYLSVQTPNGAVNHGREALRSSIFPLLGIAGVIADDPDTFGYLEGRSPRHHRMALDIIYTARQEFGVAV